MNIKTVLFDLDGTLLPMDQDVFVKDYFGRLAKKLAAIGYEPEKLIKSVWAGTMAMINNDGSTTNEGAFWKTFTSIFGEKAYDDIDAFDEFYRTDFGKVQSVCGFNPKAAETVRKIRAAGLRTVLATQPIFPSVATEQRIRWAGLEPEDFEIFTTYDNSSYCKPNLSYYKEVLDKIGCSAAECLMVGNDVGDDMVAEKLGMKVFLLTDCLINQSGEDISKYPNGSFEELLKFIGIK